jgi:hypothetical protein
VEEISATDQRDPEEVARILARVIWGVCQSCGDEGVDMECGHIRCNHCEWLNHDCMACALAL